MPDLTHMLDLASESLGGRALAASDEFFAPKENLLARGRGRFVEDEYTDRGKWMDGWETRRRREPGHDWCIVRLGAAGVIRGLDIDTNHFRGNHPEAASVDAWLGDDDPGPDAEWTMILPRSPLEENAENVFAVDEPRTFSHVRLNIHPDGGVARFRVYGEPRPNWAWLAEGNEPIDLVAAIHGGRPIATNDESFSGAANLLLPGHPVNMGDGWETRRRRSPGHDWCILQLGTRGLIERVDVETTHFKGNYPARCSLDVADLAADDDSTSDGVEWHSLLEPTALEADSIRHFEIPDAVAAPCTHARFCIYPDGGVARLRLLGRPCSG